MSEQSVTGLFVASVLVTAGLMLAAIWQIFAVAPIEAVMGIVQKIFYFHVPGAYVMYVGAVACFLGSVGFLGFGNQKADAFAEAGAELAVAFGAITMVTGPLWGRLAWGAYWTWDPRLTTTLLALLIYIAYLVLRAFGGEGEAEKKFSAALGILGVADIPIIHFSVRRWSGQHPQVISPGGGGIAPEMVPALLLSLAAFTALAIVLLWVRTRGEILARKLQDAEQRALEIGLLEELQEEEPA